LGKEGFNGEKHQESFPKKVKWGWKEIGLKKFWSFLKILLPLVQTLKWGVKIPKTKGLKILK